MGQITTKEITDTSKALLENTIPVSVVTTTIDNFLKEVEQAKDYLTIDNAIAEFEEEIKSWEVVLIEFQNKCAWLHSPIKYYKTTEEYSLTKKLKKFMEDGTFPKRKTSINVEIKSNTNVPIKLNLNEYGISIIEEYEKYKMYYSLYCVMENIKKVLVDFEEEKIAIYEKPYGVIAMNRTESLLNQPVLEKEVSATLKAMSLEVIPFYELINKNEVVPVVK